MVSTFFGAKKVEKETWSLVEKRLRITIRGAENPRPTQNLLQRVFNAPLMGCETALFQCDRPGFHYFQ